MKNLLKKTVALFLAILITVCILPGCGSNEKDDPTPQILNHLDGPEKDYPGLYVAENGAIYLGGERFYGYGINLFSTFQDTLTNYKKKTKYDKSGWSRNEVYPEDFRLCNEYGISLVRIPFCSWGYDSYNKFDKNPEEFFEIMDKIVSAAEEAHVGIIASLIWNPDTVPYYEKETRSAYGDKDSKTIEFAKKYAGAIADRYKDSPAIWGWEIGNEYNLNADLCDKNLKNWLPGSSFTRYEPSYADYFSSEDMTVFFTEVSNEIRKYDKTRLITTGNAAARGYEWNVHQNSINKAEDGSWDMSWTKDTEEQFEEMLEYYTPDPINTVSLHINIKSDFSGLTDTLKSYKSAGDKMNKAVFFGEFGDLNQYENMDETSPEEFQEMFTRLLSNMTEADIPIACGWFNWTKINDRFNHTLYKMSDVNIYKMQELQRVNNGFKEQGLQKVDEYWAKYDKNILTEQ